MNDLIDTIYPVGYIYETTNADFDPNNYPYFSSVYWSAINDCAANISTTSTAAAGTYIGSNDVILTTSQMQSHNHTGTLVAAKPGNSTGNYGNTTITQIWNNIHVTTAGSLGADSRIYGPGTTTFWSSGSNGSHNNMQPYKMVYKWERIE
jgi:microcystin-dependent protein